jgi:hypothetical protein
MEQVREVTPARPGKAGVTQAWIGAEWPTPFHAVRRQAQAMTMQLDDEHEQELLVAQPPEIIAVRSSSSSMTSSCSTSAVRFRSSSVLMLSILITHKSVEEIAGKTFAVSRTRLYQQPPKLVPLLLLRLSFLGRLNSVSFAAGR